MALVLFGCNVFYLYQEKYLVAGGEFDGIRVFDIEKETCIQTVSGHESRVKAIEVVCNPFPDEDSKCLLVFSVSSDGDLRAWSFNRDNFEEEASLLARYEMNGRPTCLTVSYPGKLSHSKKNTETEQKVQEKQEDHDISEQRPRDSGVEPTKKKIKKKKKGSSKKKKKPVDGEETTTAQPSELHEDEDEEMEKST
ncbi:p21-activated protein kinase-interacting protein 1-like [Exaiptasia diaphana]|uniref:Uncharacterized protein n=1 Tax=Exaiptasia diaphana TaxID=2652724 RepID=A0A913XR95_EXADI|nr:p21-activated protein kinase-interacting protein 1-like [Exaiptasia diaphana]KXJ09813.1 p21-activated protein kinase-interacting protein 1-like [Exaiptasia diaphana]